MEDLEAPFGLALGAGLPAQRLTVGDEAATVALAGRFRDPEGGPLSYRAVSSDPAVAAAEVAGDRVSITPVAAGRTTVRVTAGDPQGLQTTLPLAVHVLPRPNRPPELSPLADRTATAGDTLTLTVRATDPDGDRLRYTASAADSAIARAGAVDSVLTLRPLAEGLTTIAVRVRDPEGLAAADTFQLTVEPPNRPPTLTPLADLAATAGDTLTLTVRATDPDGDRLSYAAAAADTAIARARAVDSVLTLRPLAEGLTTIAVRVRDPEGLAAADTFQLTVERANQAPVAGDLDDRRLRLGRSARIALRQAFTDPDGDRLGYTAVSKNPAVAEAAVSRATLTLTPVAVGRTAVDVTATDPGGLQATASFTVTVDEPPPHRRRHRRHHRRRHHHRHRRRRRRRRRRHHRRRHHRPTTSRPPSTKGRAPPAPCWRTPRPDKPSSTRSAPPTRTDTNSPTGSQAPTRPASPSSPAAASCAPGPGSPTTTRRLTATR